MRKKLESLKKYRNKKGLTQEEVAKKLGVTQGAVMNWENGYRKPNVYVMKKMAEIFQPFFFVSECRTY